MESEVGTKPLVRAQVEYVPSQFGLHKFRATLAERDIHFQILCMDDSYLVLISEGPDVNLNNLYVSLLSRYDDLPIGTRILGSYAQEITLKEIGCKLTQKLGKRVFLNNSVEGDQRFMALVQGRLFQEFKNKKI